MKVELPRFANIKVREGTALYGHVIATTEIGQPTFAIIIGGNGGEGNYFNNVQTAPLFGSAGIGLWTFERHTLSIAR